MTRKAEHKMDRKLDRKMERMAPWAHLAYGVDCSDTATLVVCARRRRGRLVLEPAALPVKVEDGVATACAMPPGQAMAVWLQTPLASAAKTSRVLPTLLDMSMPFPLDECICAFSAPHRLRDGGGPETAMPLAAGADGRGGMAALAVAARQSDIARRLDALAAKGINPQVLDHEGLALWTQALRESPPPEKGPLRIRLVVRARRHEALLAMGAGPVFWSAHRLGGAAHGALDRTVRVQLDAAAAGRYAQAPLTWIWSGDDAAACAAWRTPAETALPGESVMLPDSEHFLARALATRALTDGPLQFNLQCGTFAPAATTRQMQAARYRRAATLAGLAAILLAINAACAIGRSREGRSAEARFMQGIEKVTGWPVAAMGEDALLIARRELEARRTGYAPLARAFAPSLLESLDAVLGAAAQEKVTFGSLLLQPGKIVLRGIAPSRTAAEALVRQLYTLYDAPVLRTTENPDGRYGLVIEGGGTVEDKP
jgi:hypothetical protein